METRSIKEFNTRSIFARWRTNNCGESQKFNSTDAALSWVQSSTREMVESGYSKAAFTLRDEHGDVLYKGHTTKTQYSYAIFNGEEKSYKIKYYE